MLRALFILLAIVSFVLAIVLDMPGLYVAAGILVVVAIIMLAVSAKKRHEKSRKSYLATTSGRNHDDELAALGIADIRPRERSRGGRGDEEDHRIEAEPEGETVEHESESSTAASPRGKSRGAKEAPAGEAPSGDGAPEPNPAEAPSSGSNEELRALGIMEIKPRNRKASSPLFDFADAPSEPDEANGRSAAAAPAVKPRRQPEDPDSPEAVATRERVRREVLTPYLQALQSAIGANTVCLLRHDDDALKYHIEAIVSKNAYARSQGHFRTRVPLLTPAIARRPVLTFRIGEKGLASSNLGYYMEPIAVKQIAVTDVPRGTSSASYFVLADTMEEGGLGEPRQHALLSQFTRVLGAVLNGGEAEIPATETTAEYRPRRDIIEEEIAQARAEKKPLALILVYLNEAEAIASEGEEAVNEAEAILEGRLRELVGPRRLEHFGELVYGIFDGGEAQAVESWVVSLQEQLRDESGPLEGGVSIGSAMLKERHAGAEAFRADATAALREAYETGACTILE